MQILAAAPGKLLQLLPLVVQKERTAGSLSLSGFER